MTKTFFRKSSAFVWIDRQSEAKHRSIYINIFSTIKQKQKTKSSGDVSRSQSNEHKFVLTYEMLTQFSCLYPSLWPLIMALVGDEQIIVSTYVCKMHVRLT